MALRPTLFDVTVVRKLDGHKICPPTFERLDAAEVLALKYEQECLPGYVSTWLVLPSPRPWDPAEDSEEATR
jgi:hypothetical protein